MSFTGKRLNSGALLSTIIILIMLCYFAAFSIINFSGFETFCTTDMYEDTLVARLMWEQKTLFPSNYLFGNQFYVVATPVLAALFYGLTGSMNLAMALATTLMSVLILVTLNWMLAPFVRPRHIRYAALLALLAGVFGPNTVIREDGQLFFVMCSFYACYLISFFYLMGDYARARESEDLRPLAFALALFLSFCTGMQSLRQTCVSMLPILCFECLTAFIRLIRHEGLWPKGRRMALIRASSYLGANIAGVLFVKLLGVGRNEIYYGQSIFSGASIRDKVKDVHNALVTVTGYDFTRAGAEPFFIIIFLFFSLIVIYAGFILIRKKDISSATACFWLLCLISVAAVIAASFVTSVSLRPIYLFPCYTLPALSLMIVLRTLKPKMQNILCLLLCLIAFANIYYSYHDEVDKAVMDPDTEFKQISEFAVDNGYELVYGSHSHTAPKVAAYSDGVLIAGCWSDDIIFKVSPHININDVYRFADYSRALFVFLPGEYELARLEAEANGTELNLLGQFGELYVCASSKQMLYPVTDNLLAAPERFPEYN